MTETKIVARINKVDIVVIENGEKRVAIKPICEALGIDVDSQRKKLNDDPILKSVTVLVTATGSDGKNYQMVTIPFKYVFGWLFQIDSRKVKEESREAVLKYQLECYDTLYRHFTLYADFVKHKQEAMDTQLEAYSIAKKNYRETNKIMLAAEKKLRTISKLTVEDYDAENRQLIMFEADEMQG